MKPIMPDIKQRVPAHQMRAELFQKQRYKQSIYQLKVVLGLSHSPEDIPEHSLVCKAISLLRSQIKQLQKMDMKQEQKQFHPKIKEKWDQRAVNSMDMDINTDSNPNRFCPQIQSIPPMLHGHSPGHHQYLRSAFPPIDWISDGEDASDIHKRLKTETEHKLGMKSENGSAMDITDQFSNDWDDSLSIFGDGSKFDLPSFEHAHCDHVHVYPL